MNRVTHNMRRVRPATTAAALTRRRFLASATTLTAAAAAVPAAQERKPNIVLIVAGGWRAQSVPWATDSELATPNLERFGRASMTFARAYTCSPKMVPARAALLHGRFMDGAAESPTIGTTLKNAGYRTSAFRNGHVDDLVTFVHDTGAPFYAEWIQDAPSRLLERSPETSVTLRPNVPETVADEAKSALAEYFSKCVARDHDIGTLLAALDRPGLEENTIVVFTGDRGDLSGSHGIFGDDAPFEESVRVPLAIRYPGAIQPAGNAMLVSLLDLYPTILGLCGIPIAETLQGRNLAAQILAGTGETPDAAYAGGKSGQPDEWRMLVHGYDKLVTSADGTITHLYNLANDPFEMNNLAEAPAERLKRDSLVAMQQVWMRKLGDRVEPSSGLKTR